mmetsp:Transcript_10131/g.23726  ORF Transcript_10131/g.23726 Transcript_10131/m.23726 type:complete len:243 (+) Transcript_10131:307-1035(+)
MPRPGRLARPPCRAPSSRFPRCGLPHVAAGVAAAAGVGSRRVPVSCHRSPCRCNQATSLDGPSARSHRRRRFLPGPARGQRQDSPRRRLPRLRRHGIHLHHAPLAPSRRVNRVCSAAIQRGERAAASSRGGINAQRHPPTSRQPRRCAQLHTRDIAEVRGVSVATRQRPVSRASDGSAASERVGGDVQSAYGCGHVHASWRRGCPSASVPSSPCRGQRLGVDLGGAGRHGFAFLALGQHRPA